LRQSEQIRVGESLLHCIDNKTTALADSIYSQPTQEYICQDVAGKEHELFFRKTPICVGLSGLLPEKETYYTHDLSGRPFLLTRDKSGIFRAFLNVCRHRGARIAESCGKRNSFSCPYHAWKYGLDGKLIARPEEISFRSSPKENHALTELKAIERNGILWVMPQPEGTMDLDTHLDTIDTDLQNFKLDNLHHHETRTLTRKMNWKLVMDTFFESYHFCVLHKNSICSIFHENLSTFDTSGDHFRLIFARRTIEEIRSHAKSSWDVLPHIVSIYVLFPNTVLVWQADHIELWQIFPGKNAPEEAVIQLSFYTPEKSVDESSKRHWDNNLDLVLHVVENEDFPVGEGTQKGFHTGAQSHITFGANEPALAHFHRTVTNKLKHE
jgi:phenylpropionate dioxygenase-like ring-hydroxylating dioxygenase large terminal subunit